MKELKRQVYRHYSTQEQATWRHLFTNLEENRRSMAVPMFAEGLEALGLHPGSIPDLADVNARLKRKTGWTGVPVEGLEAGDSFYPALARREYPIGNFIRDANDVNYTPAPDIFHDLYGHMPFFMNGAYADFCQEYGRMVVRHMHHPERLQRFERFFWFTIEFALTETPRGRRIFGAGILSSKGESEYSLSDAPEVVAFDVKQICDQPYEIDKFQHRIFLLDCPEQLYDSLSEVEEYVIAAEPSAKR